MKINFRRLKNVKSTSPQHFNTVFISSKTCKIVIHQSELDRADCSYYQRNVKISTKAFIGLF